jgi:hypothetical protein
MRSVEQVAVREQLELKRPSELDRMLMRARQHADAG